MREKPNPYEGMSRKERREAALDQVFGKNRKEYMGNIWGWKFTYFGLVFLLAVFAFAAYGVWTGKIDLKKQQFEATPSKHIQQNSLHHQKDTAN